MRWPCSVAFAVLAVVAGGRSAEGRGPARRAGRAAGSVLRTPWGDPDLQGVVEPRHDHAAGTAGGVRRPRAADGRGNRGGQPRVRDAGHLGAAKRADSGAGRRPRLQPVLVGPRHLDRPHVAYHRSAGRTAARRAHGNAGSTRRLPKRSGWPRPSGGGCRRTGRRTWIWATAVWSTATCRLRRAVTTTTFTFCSRPATSPSSRSRSTTSASFPCLRAARASGPGPSMAGGCRAATGRATRWSSRPVTSTHRPTIWGRARTAASSSGSAGAVRDAIEYSFTVTDPSVWTRSWSGMVPWRPGRRSDVRVRLSRGQLRHDQSPHVVAGGRGPPREEYEDRRR